MSRPTYEQHRATRASSTLSHQYPRGAMRRRGSFAESETDLESLASYSTHHSSSSFQASGSPHQSYPFPPSRLSSTASPSAQNPYFLFPRQRTYSSTSHTSSHLELPARATSSGRNISVVSESPVARAERRAKRRETRHQKQLEKSTLSGEAFDSPIRRWLRWMKQSDMGRWSLILGLTGVGVVKCAVGLGGFSGRDAPPMYGDFEAQRHWMEVTIHRPLREWYTYGPEWWQLDYPPVTGYISYICGKIGSALNPKHFELDLSRGTSPDDLVTFMRMSVVSLEALFWWTAVVAWVFSEGQRGGRSWRSQVTGIMTILLQPSLILIDNGHFQYNSVLLGFSLFSLMLLSRNHDGLACVCFSLALGFKQMGLYYAPAIGCYLLGKCVWLGGFAGLLHLVKLGIVTSLTFLAIFSPWLKPFPTAIQQVVHRMFPFARGIFEDKVANFWCASNVVIKWKRYFGVTGMARLATVATLVGLLPTISMLLYCSYSLRVTSAPATSPSPKTESIPKIQFTQPTPSDHRPLKSHPPGTTTLLPIALFTSSLTFFLLSFQVHEKSILLPLMPLTILMAFRGSAARGSEISAMNGEQGGDEIWEFGALINNVAVFSMWPLIKRDGQGMGYVVVTLLWNWLIGYSPFSVHVEWIRILGFIIYSLVAIIHVAELLTPYALPLPKSYPDLYVVLNVLLSFGVFGIAWLWGLKKLLEGAWALGGFSLGSNKKTKGIKGL